MLGVGKISLICILDATNLALDFSLSVCVMAKYTLLFLCCSTLFDFIGDENV